ncbi:VWA domain-containing protein (plasmid) [Halorientalis pallida]|uniref:VWA domain-containing protein n=1 Tax=Halorientalis pallida TaxID=2479928 RepID=UPI003C6FE2F8
MPQISALCNPESIAREVSPTASARARISDRRATRLQDFILGHLPPDIDVDVLITRGVKTAAVLPADIDAILSSAATDLERGQISRLLNGVNADYLVLVTGTEADLERVPLNDQLTADHAHQFGLAFHELLHILKTAIVAIDELLKAEVDSQYHEQVHDLINIVEDGAIESEAIHGENFSDNAGIRLELTRRIHSSTPEDIPDDEEVKYSFWDGVTACLYEESIYPTGITSVLLDETDSRITFVSDEDERAFERVHGPIVALARDALAIRSAERDDTTHSHDKTASIRRARLVIDLWTKHIQPLLERNTDTKHNQVKATPQQDRPEDSGGEGDEEDSGNGEDESVNKGPTDNVGPEGVSLSREATEDPHQNIFEQPQITDEPDPREITEETNSFADETTGTPTERSESDDGAGTAGQYGEELDTGKDTPKSCVEQLAQAIDRTRKKESEQPDCQTSQSQSEASPHSGTDSTSGQHSLSDFEPGPEQDEVADSEERRTEDEGEKADNTSYTDTPDGPTEHDSVEDQLSAIAEGNSEEESPAGKGPEADSSPSQHEGPAHAQSTSRTGRDDKERFEEALSHDERAAHDEATQDSLDEHGLEQELDDIVRQLERAEDDSSELNRNSTNSSESDKGGGSTGGPESLTEIEALPVGDDIADPREWEDVEKGAEQVGRTLGTYLRLERQEGERAGLTTGSYDTRAGHRLAIGDPRVCKSAIPGEEKQYAIVLVLDRSYSMCHGSPQKIEVATQALARFGLAAEQLGIKVSIIDFIHGQARLVKPFSVEIRHVQPSLLNTSYGGGTPLADALGLARTLIEAQRDEPLIIAVTDDQPADIDGVKKQIRASHAPVCSLTIATDQQTGSLPDDASELSRYYERQETVYSPERLDDRLDQFASLLAGL